MRAFFAKVTSIADISSASRAAHRHMHAALQQYPVEIVIRRLNKSRDQEKQYHVLIADISRQYRHSDRRWHREDMKRLLVDAFWHDTHADPEFADEWKDVSSLQLAPAIGRDGFVALGMQTRRFSKKLASAFIDWLFAFGNENGVRWSDPSLKALEQYKEAA